MDPEVTKVVVILTVIIAAAFASLLSGRDTF